jgi:hypothetical protein
VTYKNMMILKLLCECREEEREEEKGKGKRKRERKGDGKSTQWNSMTHKKYLFMQNKMLMSITLQNCEIMPCVSE